VSYSPALLAVLVLDRQRAVARDFASARRFRLRRSVAAAVYALASAFAALGAVLDEEPAVA
jgi:hypothetical protein